jgi:hypothetical protein
LGIIVELMMVSLIDARVDTRDRSVDCIRGTALVLC